MTTRIFQILTLTLCFGMLGCELAPSGYGETDAGAQALDGAADDLGSSSEALSFGPYAPTTRECFERCQYEYSQCLARARTVVASRECGEIEEECMNICDPNTNPTIVIYESPTWQTSTSDYTLRR